MSAYVYLDDGGHLWEVDEGHVAVLGHEQVELVEVTVDQARVYMSIYVCICLSR